MRQCAIVEIVEKGRAVVYELCWWLPTASPAANLLIFYAVFIGTVLAIALLHKRLGFREQSEPPTQTREDPRT